MKICLNCGIEDQNWICENCRISVDIEDLCNTINTAENLKSLEKSLLIIDCLTSYKKYLEVFAKRRKLFYQNANICLNNCDISEDDKNFIIYALFVNHFRDYNYEEAEKLAKAIKDNTIFNKSIIYELGKYYIYTRRYDLAKQFLEKRISLIDENDTENLKNSIHKTYEDIQKRINGEMKEYMPLGPENQKKYSDFMTSMGFNLDSIPLKKVKKASAKPDKIAPKDYPNIKENEITDSNFDTFVAFDLETTGFQRKISLTSKNKKIDDIIEIAAIKVVNGKIEESEKFIFQKLVHPISQKVSDEITNLTGITNEMVRNAEPIWKVFPKFMEFVGDNILVGFNCINFDCDFLIRAGRYSNIIINNKFYDIYRNLDKFGIKNLTLGELSKKFNIENPNAHRALFDAITTAKVFIELKTKKS